MLFGRKKAAKAPAQPERQTGEERRDARRYQTMVVTCSLGDLKDLSRSGCRVQRVGVASQTKFAPDQCIPIELYSPSDSVTLNARIVRFDKLGPGRTEIMLEFVDLGREQGDMIENLARYGVARSPSAASVSENARKLVAALRLPDHYKALGINRKASAEEIQKAFRMLARKYHPDVNADPAAVGVFQQINEAHEVLCDPEQRAKYDEITSFGEAA